MLILPRPPLAGNTTDAAADYHRRRQDDGAACLAAALDYLARGWSALAVCTPNHVGVGKTHGKDCKSPGKAPWGPWKSFQKRLPTEAELRQKWRANPQLNVGVALGGVTGLVGLDVDGEPGEAVLARLSTGDVPDTLEFTSGKGRRLLYRVPEGVELRPSPNPGGEAVEGGELRLLGLGSQTVMPPSRHKDSGRRYTWRPGHGPGEVDPPVAPAWVVDLMKADAPRAGRPGGHKSWVFAPGEKVLEGKRNSFLASWAGLFRRYRMSEQEIVACLAVLNESRCDPPLDDGEVAKVAHSIAGYATGPALRPRGPDILTRRLEVEL
jgi:hypothetical protein